MARIRGRNNSYSSPAKTIQIPLNDDAAEKAGRLKERSLLQEVQKQKMKAIASPGRQSQGSPGTPRNIGVRSGEGALDAVTPLRKVPILANFEEMMKMATDNKFNAANAWNFALIDYFHDMSLLKEGDGVNFQKASCTLDGCVKIYTSRVDSVATETGKLLSGLADSSSKKKGKGGDEEGEGAEDSDAEGEEDGEGRKRPKKRAQRSSETTLAKDFGQLRIKKFELEFSVDPLFKKASADFDEGGAKGLLLNHLSIDNNGRIVFDSSDDKEEKSKEDEDEGVPSARLSSQEGEEPEEKPAILSKLAGLRNKFFPDPSKLEDQWVCPSMKNVDLGDPANTLDIPFLKALEDRNDAANEAPDSSSGAEDDVSRGGDGMNFGFDDGYGIGNEDDMIMGFGEGGEAWANETLADAADRLLSPSRGAPLMGLGGGDKSGIIDSEARDFTVGFGAGHEDILGYFDEALRKNWAGPEHWRIRRIKENAKPANTVVRQRREKEAFEIDFSNPAADVPDDLLAPPKSLRTISMPQKDRISKTRHLLPDDKHFNSKQLLRLFLKPKASLSRRRSEKPAAAPVEPENMDEEFWARENMARELQASSTPERNATGNYDANFFADDDGGLGLPAGLDDDDDDVFADAPEGPTGDAPTAAEAPLPSSQIPGSQIPGPFGSQLITSSRRVRPEYVQYARVAKKVDVRKLKENLWSGLAFEAPPEQVAEATPPASEEPRKFTSVINDLRAVYPEKTMADISTSYCFICVLHLANEKGLIIEEEGGALQELMIKKDLTAGEADAF